MLNLTKAEISALSVAVFEMRDRLIVDGCSASLRKDRVLLARIETELRTVNDLLAKLKAEHAVLDYLTSEKERIARYAHTRQT